MKKAANLLSENVADIMAIWKQSVEKEIVETRHVNDITLQDHLPNIINDIADILLRHENISDLESDNTYKEVLYNSAEHGRHRASTSSYSIELVVHEYIIFHRTLSSYLKRHNGYGEAVSDLLKYVIETCILKSVGAFSRAIQEMQEKLIGTLSHDIRNPLTVSLLSLEILENNADQSMFDSVKNAGTRGIKKALNLLESLMDGITVKAGEGMTFDFSEIDIIHEIKWVCKETVQVNSRTINLNCSVEELIGIFDGTAVRRMLENLITNALKYGDASKPITISVNNIGDAVELSVHNFGEPISQKEQEDIFKFLNRGSKDESDVKGWGMGLALTQMVAKAHGGNAKLSSNKTDGTTFCITILKNHNTPGKKRAKLRDSVIDSIS